MANIREILEKKQLRCTKQREMIYEALASTRCHPTAEELFAAVRTKEPGLSLATIYNTLDALTECGMVRRIPCPMGTGACRFDWETHDHVHVTTSDGRIMDAPEDLSARLLTAIPPEVLAEIEQRMGVKVCGLSLQVVADQRPSTGC